MYCICTVYVQYYTFLVRPNILSMPAPPNNRAASRQKKGSKQKTWNSQDMESSSLPLKVLLSYQRTQNRLL